MPDIHPGTGLRICNPSDILVTKEDYKDAVRKGRPSFLRCVDVSLPVEMSEATTMELIELVDEVHYPLLASKGVPIVGHEWLVYPLNVKLASVPCYPDGFRLAAEVETVMNPIAKNYPLMRQIGKKLTAYRDEVPDSEPYLCDLKSDQVVVTDTTSDDPRATVDFTFTDLDLFFSLVKEPVSL